LLRGGFSGATIGSWNRYPSQGSVKIQRGRVGFFSIFFRSFTPEGLHADSEQQARSERNSPPFSLVDFAPAYADRAMRSVGIVICYDRNL